MSYIILLGILWNIGLLLQSFYSLMLFNKQKSLIPTTHYCTELHILIAIRNEEMGHVCECIEYFLSQKNIAKLTIALTEIDDDHKKYLSLLEEYRALDSRLSYTIFQGSTGRKAEQINVALESIRESGEKVLVAIYDVDSRPDRDVFEYVQNNEIQVGQQFILYDANLKDLNPLSLAGALHQTSWAIGFEMFNFFFPKKRLVYTVGHGLFLSSETLQVSGLFDDGCMTEDLMYGYKASIAKRSFQVIPYFEHAKFVRTSREFIWQSARWYVGELELIKRFEGWYVQFNGGFKDKINFYIRIAELFWWPLERILYIITIVGALIGLLSIRLALLYTVILVISGYISAIVVLKFNGWDKRLIAAPLLIPFWHTVSVVGPVSALIKKLLGFSITWTITRK